MKTILLADDEKNLRTLVRATLEDPGYRIIEASDGPAAIALTRVEAPDLVLLDWRMPGMSGIDVVRILRGDSATAHLPVVMLTANEEQSSRMEALGLAVEAYLVKPFSPLELVERVRRILADLDTQANWTPSGGPVLTDEVRQHLDHSDSQLALYARDVKRLLESERRSAEALAQAYARLETLSSLKTEFLAFISHELRTPLNALSILESLDPNADAAERRDAVEIACTGYAGLRSFIERGLEYLNWLAVDHVPDLSTVDMIQVVRTVVDCTPALQTPEGRVQLLAPEEVCFVRADEAHLRDLVRILLENAAKFSPREAPIQVEVQPREDRVILTVSDQGVGLHPERIHTLFEPYSIVDVAHHSSGSGLHLAIAHHIVRAHGGDIRVESPGPGQGSTFSVRLPATNREDASLPRRHAIKGSGT